MRRAWFAVGLLSLGVLAGCGDATAPMHSVDGVWQGTSGTESLTLRLTMHTDQTVTGSGIDSSMIAGVQVFPVSGTVSGPTVVLVFDPVAVSAGFSGKFVNDETLTGSVDFPHFAGDVRLSRLPGHGSGI
jgi:hypothetical protein